MESLPDELLLEVFSRLQDGVVLLDGVGLVCKRWHALSCDPRAWRGVRVEFDMMDWHWQGSERRKREKASMNKARVVLHAPVLRFLGWSWDCPGPHINKPQAIALSAVRRSPAAIREIYLGGVSFMAEPAWAVFVGLLRRNGEHLTTLSVELPQEWDEEEEEEEDMDEAAVPVDAAEEEEWSLEEDQSNVVAAWDCLEGGDSLLEVLSKLPRLEWLRFDMPFYCPYAAELAVKGELMPALRYLDLSQEGPAQLMVDLVRGTAARLRHLRLPDEHVLGRALMRSGRPSRCLSPGLLASVSRCVELRSLAANLMHVACVSDMPHLRSLELWLSDQEVPAKDAAAIARFLTRYGKSLSGLRCLKLQHKGSLREPPLWNSTRASVEELILAVARAAPNVTELEIYLDAGSEDLVDKVLSCLPRLRDVDLCWTKQKDHVETLAALPELRRVSGYTCDLQADVIEARLKMARQDLELVTIF